MGFWSFSQSHLKPTTLAPMIHYAIACQDSNLHIVFILSFPPNVLFHEPKEKKNLHLQVQHFYENGKLFVSF